MTEQDDAEANTTLKDLRDTITKLVTDRLTLQDVVNARSAEAQQFWEQLQTANVEIIRLRSDLAAANIRPTSQAANAELDAARAEIATLSAVAQRVLDQYEPHEICDAEAELQTELARLRDAEAALSDIAKESVGRLADWAALRAENEMLRAVMEAAFKRLCRDEGTFASQMATIVETRQGLSDALASPQPDAALRCPVTGNGKCTSDDCTPTCCYLQERGYGVRSQPDADAPTTYRLPLTDLPYDIVCRADEVPEVVPRPELVNLTGEKLMVHEQDIGERQVITWEDDHPNEAASSSADDAAIEAWIRVHLLNRQSGLGHDAALWLLARFDAARQAGVREGREQMREEAAREAEKHTIVHTASLTIAEAIRTLAPDPKGKRDE